MCMDVLVACVLDSLFLCVPNSSFVMYLSFTPSYSLYSPEFQEKNCGDEQGLNGPHVQIEPRKLS